MRSDPDLRECLSCSCFAVRRAARAITQHYDRLLRPTGLRATQFGLLVVLELEGPLPLSRAAARLGMERTTLTRNLRPLVASGLVREGEDDDRRVRMLALTRQGIAQVHAALPRWREAQRSIAARLGAPVIQALSLAAGRATGMAATQSSRTTHRSKED
jgi:DNA-binding MarR family transcriptional regulator